MSGALQFELPPEAVSLIVEEVADRVRAELTSVSPWMTRKATAAYLDVPVSRLEKDRTAPCHRWEGRIMYHRGELDEWLRSM